MARGYRPTDTARAWSERRASSRSARVPLPEDAPVGAVLAFDIPEPSTRGLVRSGVLVSAVALVSQSFNVVFHFATARILGREEYSLLTSMFAVYLIGTVPLLALQATVVREMSTLLAGGDEAGAGMLLRGALRTVLRAAAIAVAVAVVLFIPLIAVLHVDRPLPIVAVIVAFMAAVPGPIASGALQATERFGALSATQSLQSALKLIAGIGLALAGVGASAITFGVAGAQAAAFVAMIVLLRPLLRRRSGERRMPARRIVGRYAIGAAVVLGLHTTLISTDLLWARGALDPSTAGLYAAASVATSVLLLIPVGVTTVLFPRVAKLQDASGERRLLRFGAAAVSALGLLGVGIVALIPTQLLHLSFGTQYDGAAPWLAPLGLAMVGYSVAIVYLNHFLAQGRTRVAWVMVGTLVVQQALFAVLHGSGHDIVVVQMITAGTLVLGSEVFDRVDTGHREDRVGTVPT